MDATTRPIIASPDIGSRPGIGRRVGRGLTLAALGVMTIVAAFASLRLAAVVSATPRGLWLEEVPRLVDLRYGDDARLGARAAAVANVIADPALFTASAGLCNNGDDASVAACARNLDAALDADPASAELWTFKAWTRARSGDYSDPTFAALRNSYAFAPREGWIAADRVVFVLSLYPLLPDDLRADVASDLHLVLGLGGMFSQPLITAYANNSRLRDTAADALHALSADDIERFVSRVRRQINS